MLLSLTSTSYFIQDLDVSEGVGCSDRRESQFLFGPYPPAKKDSCFWPPQGFPVSLHQCLQFSERMDSCGKHAWSSFLYSALTRAGAARPCETP